MFYPFTFLGPVGGGQDGLPCQWNRHFFSRCSVRARQIGQGFPGRLEYLHAEMAWMRGTDAASTSDTFSMTPFLRNLVIEGPPYTAHVFTPSFAHPRTANVSTLSIIGMNPTDKCLSLLRSFPLVRNVDLFCIKSQIASGQPLTFPYVSHLGLIEGFRRSIADMHSRVVLPCITLLFSF
ncbi:uncharacterized protein BT62DRAFT_738941 [Guyanagaster necrorhizus]|uniref:Uncharacterized protein n=1 Tax=Guyanagaster necrorhizus TaxID=856835 RepID=A0A9P8AL45_9AGAR|nr:uncharacterized protein BT62DRAFT_738941 [Guyanagaster necrorhizus MCA 3950]KAG7439385.1 hypothetical protein BT62DRAFT_738941 [Guyanagaster necrorhizus MCA 3950]